MKKSILAVAGLATIASVAAPVAGVFATVTGSPLYDTIETTVAASCAFGGGNNTTTVTLSSGSGSQADANAMTVKCNTVGGWKVSAMGVSAATGTPTPQTTMKNGDYTIATSASGTGWGFSVAVSGTTTSGGNAPAAAEGFSSRHVIPGEGGAKVASGDVTNDTTITPTYYVTVADDQAAGKYTGYVQYTLTDGGQS